MFRVSELRSSRLQQVLDPTSHLPGPHLCIYYAGYLTTQTGRVCRPEPELCPSLIGGRAALTSQAETEHDLTALNLNADTTVTLMSFCTGCRERARPGAGFWKPPLGQHEAVSPAGWWVSQANCTHQQHLQGLDKPKVESLLAPCLLGHHGRSWQG